MRILMLADTPADPNRGAAGTEVQTMLALREAGQEVDAIWSDDMRRRVRHENLHVLLELPREYQRVAIDALRKKTYDVVHVNQPHGFRAARAVRRIAPRTVFVHRSHGFELNVEDSLRPFRKRFGKDVRPLYRRAASRVIAPLLARHSRAIVREADGHVVSSSSDARYLESMGVPPDCVAVIPHAAPDIYVHRPAPPMTAERLRTVFYVGQFAFIKAPMITAAAMNRIAEERADARFTWVCDRAHHADVRALLSPAANQRIELLHWMPQEELVRVYDRGGVFLFPSFYEGFGKAFIEAMARGACVVATRVGGMADVITDGTDGMLVPPGDAEAVAAAALSILGDEARAATMSEAAARTARQFTWSGFAARLIEFYQHLIEAKSA